MILEDDAEVDWFVFVAFDGDITQEREVKLYIYPEEQAVMQDELLPVLINK